MIRAVVIDDEQSCRSVLCEHLSTFCPSIQVIGQADSALSGLQLVKEKKPDVVFLDVEMPDYSGFEFLDFFNKIDFEVIFSTAHQNYALKAFEVSAFGYLLKPVNVKQLLKIVDDLERKQHLEHIEERVSTLKANVRTQGDLKRIALPVSNGLLFIEIEDILYLKADGSYTNFYLENGEKILVAKKLKTFDFLTGHPDFYRTHRSYLVNLKHVQQYVKQDGGFILMRNDDAVSIARDRKEDFLSVMR